MINNEDDKRTKVGYSKITRDGLAFAELKWIVDMQKEGLCLEQLPEGAGPNSRTYWEKNYEN